MRNVARIFSLALCALLAACAGGSHTSSSAAGASPAASPSAAASATAAPASAASTQTVSFTDLNGYDGAQYINDVAALGVLDQTSGAFRPNDLVTRAEFVRWLVKAQNAFFSKEPHYQIRPARGTTATFVDVPATNPDFKDIQGLADAGFVIGVDATHFAPDKPLTREQMVYIKSCVDEKSDIKTNGNAMSGIQQYADANKINPKFVGAVYEGESAGTTGTFKRVYGTTKYFRPQQPVTRGEAAIALSVMKGEWNRTAAAVLGRTPYPGV